MATNLHFLSLDIVGGVETLFCELMKHYPVSSDINCIALYSKGIHNFFSSTINAQAHTVKSIKYLGKIKLPKWPSQLRKWNHQRIIHTSNPDVLIFWNTIDGAGYISRKPFPRDARIVFYDQGASWYKTRDLFATQRFLSQTSFALCCSYASKRMMELYHQYTGEIKVVHNPLRPDFLHSTSTAKGLPINRRVRLGVAGRFLHIKGIGLAIHTVEILKHRGVDVELHIAGTGKYEAAYKKLARQLGVETQVVFLGVVKDMPQYFKSIDIFLCPSIREPLGIVAVEAMGSGCPLICSKIDGLAEVVEHNETGFSLSPTLPITEYNKLGGGLSGLPEVVYYPELDDIGPPKVIDPGAIADAVQKVLADNNQYIDMSAKCIETTKKKFSFDRYTEKIVSALSAG